MQAAGVVGKIVNSHRLPGRNLPVFEAQARVIEHNIGRVGRELRHLGIGSVDGKEQLERRAAEHVNLQLILRQQEFGVGAQAHILERRTHGRVQLDGLESSGGSHQRVDSLADQEILECLELRAVLWLRVAAGRGKRIDHLLRHAHPHGRSRGQVKSVGNEIALVAFVEAGAVQDRIKGLGRITGLHHRVKTHPVGL